MFKFHNTRLLCFLCGNLSLKHTFFISALLAFCTPVLSYGVQSPDYSEYHQENYLTFVSPAGNGAARLLLGFSQADMRPIVMDTGSTGIVISADRIPQLDTLNSTPGQITYTSSGRVMIGQWVTLPVIISGNNNNFVKTRPIPVLAVTRIACLPSARECKPNDQPQHVAIMGVGFGHEQNGQKGGTPESNPFLNIAASNGEPIRRGYIVTQNGVHIGLTQANTAGHFSFVKLQANPAYGDDWLGAPVCITVNSTKPALCGRSLIDTGVSDMFLTLPASAAGGAETLASGTTLTFNFPDAVHPAASYTITVGSQDAPMSPKTIYLNTKRPTPFVNTGIAFLQGFDVLYDADGGYIGYQNTGS